MLPYKTIVELGFETVKEASLREGEKRFKNGRLGNGLDIAIYHCYNYSIFNRMSYAITIIG